jgi:hypothetical protein
MRHTSAFFILLLAALPLASLGQRCKTDVIRNRNIANNPAIETRVAEINRFTEQWIEAYDNNASSRAVVTVPVVVHVLWRVPRENISDAQIQSQIDVLNEDFGQLNSNFASNTPTPFQAIAADVEIEFCLAKEDPQGNPSTGITHLDRQYWRNGGLVQRTCRRN